MKKILITLLLIAICVPFGYLLRATFTPEIDRAERALNLFTTYCVPSNEGVRADPIDGLVALNGLPDEETWAEANSQLLVVFKDGRCGVDDRLRPYSQEQRVSLKHGVTRLVEDGFPMLKTDPDWALVHPVNGLWVQYPFGDAERWGISLVTFFDGDVPTSETMLTFNFKRP